MMESNTAAIVITGPTGVGKTAVSSALAAKFPAEIVSADSRQVYRYMDVGTAKPSLREREQAPHHFIDICTPDEVYSAGQFGREARLCVLGILKRGRTPLIVGGSGLYLRALLQGFSGTLPSNRKLQGELKQRAQQEGITALYDELKAVDPASAQQLHPHDGHRIVRALEVFYTKNVPQRILWEKAGEPAPFAYKIFVLNSPRQILYAHLDRRVERMIAEGLVEECRRLLALGYAPELNALQTVGYREAFQFLRNEITHVQMIELIQRHTRQYAKRQWTWFRKIAEARWLEMDEFGSATAIVDQIALLIP